MIRVVVHEPGWTESGILRSWLVLLLLGLALLAGALVLADRLGARSCSPIRALAAYAAAARRPRPAGPVAPTGPAEVRELTGAMNRLVGRIEVLLERERAGVADVSHRLRTPITALRLRVEALPQDEDRARLAADLDDLEAMVDHVVREARRSEREGLAPSTDGVAVLADRVRFWEPLAEDQGRAFDPHGRRAPGAVPVRASEEDLVALVDVLLDNVFTHTPRAPPSPSPSRPGPRAAWC